MPVPLLFCLWAGVVTLLGLSTMSHAQTNTTILVFGDSLGAGYGLNEGESWPDLLQRKLDQDNYAARVINHSVSGETTAGGLSRLNNSLQQSTPDIVILELGANDGLRGLSIKAMRNNLDHMIQKIQSSQAEVLLVGMQIPGNYGPQFQQLFHKQFIELAETHQLAFLPFLMDRLGTGLEYYQADGLHPTAQAQPLLLESIWPVLKPMLSKNRP